MPEETCPLCDGPASAQRHKKKGTPLEGIAARHVECQLCGTYDVTDSATSLLTGATPEVKQRLRERAADHAKNPDKPPLTINEGLVQYVKGGGED